jgi:putative peptidoglycan lipid II flippase
MVKNIFNFFHKEISGLHQAAYLLAFFAFLSQLLALVRDRTLAHVFGASHILDIYYAAFRIPDFIFVSIGSMVSISVLVPFFVEKMEKNFDEAKDFIGNIFSIFFITISLVGIIVYFLVPSLVPWVLPGFAHDPYLPQLILLIRIFLLSPILLGLSNFFASITQLYNRFLLYALSPLFYNLGIIIGALFLYPIFGIAGLGYGVALGALMHCIIQIPFIIEQKIFPRFTFHINFSSIKKVVLLSFPRTLTLSSNQISTFFLIAMASFMSAGSISIFNFSFNLQSVPLSIIGVSYTSAAFPMLSKIFSSGNREKFIEQMAVSSRHIIFWSTPAMILFTVLRAQIVRVILGSGKFNWSDTRLTAACLAVFTLSIIPQSLIILFVRAYYSGGETKKPMYINLFSSTFIVVLGYGLIKLYTLWPFFHYFMESLFKIDGLNGTVVLMLPLAYSIGVLVNTILHWVAFEKDFKGYSKPVLDTFFQVFSAAVIMGYVSYLMLNVFSRIFDLDTVRGIFLQGFFAGIIGIFVYIVILKLLRNPEIDEIWRALHSKIWKAKVIIPD